MRKFLQSHKIHQAKYLNQSFRSFSTEKTFKIGIIPGDGIGKEVIPSAETVLKAIPPEFSGAKFEFVHLDAGFETFQKTGNSLPPATVEALRSCNGALFGAVSSPTQKVQGYSSPIVAMRKLLDLYGNLRPVISAPLHSSKQFVDLLIVRENTECLYVKKERLEDNGNKAIADRVITRSASTRIAELAFQRAQKRRNERPKTSKKQPLVTIVHKSNVLSVTDGLFRECCFEVAKKYPDIPVEEQIVDSMVYKLILEPQRYDVVVAPNLYGDILSDAGAALVGGLGIVPSANVSDAFALCEPVHGSAPDIAGKGIANPVAAIRSAALLLENLPNFPKGKLLSDLIEQNVAHTLRRGPKTPDLHEGRSTTSQVTETIVQKMLEDIQREQKK